MSKNRVIAIQSLEDGVLKTYGEGEITFGLVPDVEPFKELGVTNPCIKLDTWQARLGVRMLVGRRRQIQGKILGCYNKRRNSRRRKRSAPHANRKR